MNDAHFFEGAAKSASLAEAAMERLKSATPARLGTGRAGARYKTHSMLRFFADQTTAADAVWSEVPPDIAQRLGVFEVGTLCKSKYEMVTRPDLGRLFDGEAMAKIKESCLLNPQVQIYFGDGLSSPAIEANIPQLYPAIRAELESRGIIVGTPFFVRYCRVNTARVIGPLIGAEVVCLLIGERPGLLTSESMSAYIAYNPRPDMKESEYSVVSNISRVGIPLVEAAAYISDLIAKILEEKRSGLSVSPSE